MNFIERRNIKITSFKFSWIEKAVCYGSLSLLALLPIAELVLRRFHLTIPDSRSIITHFFLVAGFFAAMLTAKISSHISITVVNHFIKSEKLKKVLNYICITVSVFLLTVLAWNSVSFIIYGLSGRLVGFKPDRFFAIAMPLAYIVIAARFCLKLETWPQRFSAFSAILIGTAAALPAIAKIIWGIDPYDTPQPYYNWINFFYDAVFYTRVPLIVFLIFAAFCGMPVFAAIGGIAMVMLQAAGMEPDVVPKQVYFALTNMDIVAIPLFTLTGFFLSESKAGERLVRSFRAFFGWFPSGMIIATVVICAFFSSFTGASGVTILALGGILYKILSDNKYSEKFSIGLLTSAGGAGIMFPPSLPIILMASTSNVILHFMGIPIRYDVIHYLIGGIVPGILLIIGMIIIGLILSSKVKIETEPFNFKTSFLALKESAFEILLPILMIIGFFSGRLTLVETSAFSVIYVIIVEVFIKKDIALKDITKVFTKASPIIGGVLAILAMASALSYAFVDTGVPESFTNWMQDTVRSRFVFLLLLNIALIVLGSVMDIFSALLIFLPLVVPLGYVYGIDPLHLGIIFIVNLEAGFLTPPVGINLFLASYRFEKPFMRVCRYVTPFLLVRLVILILVTYIPLFTVGPVELFLRLSGGR